MHALPFSHAHTKIFDCIEPGLFVSLTNGSFVGAHM